MKIIEHLEIHVAHSCNLSCESCSHYSNHGHSGIVDLAEADSWMRLWSSRLSPATFSLLGGEPTLHPQFVQFVKLARSHWPRSKLRLVTNGFFLYRHPELPRLIAEDKNIDLYVSIHHDSQEYLKKFAPVQALLDAWKEVYKIETSFYISYDNWTRRYHGFGSQSEPFNDVQPRQSWEICPAKFCPQIYEGKLWKCAPVAYLTLQKKKFDLSGAWMPYLQYQPLDSTCSESELTKFFLREEEAVCNMCPAYPRKISLPLPFKGIVKHL